MVDDIKIDVFEKTKFEDDTNYTSIDSQKIVDNENYTANPKISYGYDSLYTASQKLCYELIGESAYKISEEKQSNGFYAIGKVKINDPDFTDRDMDICIKSFTMDHPEIFWITNQYTYGTVSGQSVIQLYSYVSGSECTQRITELTDTVNDIIASVPSGLKQYHLEKYIHNILLDKCTYATGVEYAEDGWEEFTSYGALVKGSAVCEGYAHAFCLLLNKLGIDCYYVNGYGENAPHMWNSVKINDEWYHIDVTWDDNENAYFNYFNLDDTQIQTDHVIEPVLSDIKDRPTMPDIYNVFLPVCNSDRANYFVIESTYISDFEESRDIMVNDLIEAAQKGDDMFTVKISDTYDFETAIDLMFNTEPCYMFDYIREANSFLDSSHQIANDNLAIIMISNFNSVVVRLEYN